MYQKDCMYGWMYGFHTLMGKPTGTLVPARCKGVSPILHGFFNIRQTHGRRVKTNPRLKLEPKLLEAWDFAWSIPFISSFQKYLNTNRFVNRFFADFFWSKFSNFFKIGLFSNCYIQTTNKGKNDIDPLLKSSEIGFYFIPSNQNFLLMSANFEE